MNQPNESAKPLNSDLSPINPTDAPETPEMVRQLIVPGAIENKAKSEGDRSPGLDRHETGSKLTTTPPAESEVIRELIVPGAESQAKSEGDRSPGLDRHETVSKLTPIPPAESEVIRELIVPEAES